MNLYRRKTFPASFAVLLACLIGLTVVSTTQQRRRAAHKLRATGLLELTTDQVGTTTARVVPITILDEGRFYDAGDYKAMPRPMALDNGVVYEAQKSGQVVGFVTIVGAAKDPIWRALGKWQPAAPPGPEKASAAGKPSPTPMVAGAGSSNSDRPILRRGDSSGAGAQAPPAASPTPATPSPTPAAAATPSVASNEPDDPSRPVLRRRGPEAAKQQQPTSSPQSTKTPQAVEGAVPAAKIPVPTPGMQTMVAVSDAEASDARSYQFVWKKGEQADMEAKMRRLALAQLPRENAQVSLTNVVIRAFDLDLSNDAVMVLTAEVPGGYVAPGAKNAPSASAQFVSRYITLIARVNLEGNPQRLAVSITDSSRLDVAPRMELIDAVDVDGDGLGELLFRQYSFDQKSYIIYGVGRNTVTKVFEGASSPLK
jgi:hypothetical protein